MIIGGFVCDYLPNYERHDDVHLSDLLFRYLFDNQPDEDDIKWIQEEYETEEKVFQALKELDKKLLSEAVDAYYEKLHSRTSENISSSLHP